MNVTVRLANPARTFGRIFDKEAKIYANTRLHAYCSPYVPMDTGTLDQTVDITDKYVKYKVPYAERVHEGDGMNFSTDKHPLATAHWERAMAVAKGQQLADDITAYLRSR